MIALGVFAGRLRGRNPIERLAFQNAYFDMLRRAGFSLVLALVAAIWGFTGILRVTAPFGKILFFVAAAFCLLSLLFSLFEAGPVPEIHDAAKASPQL